MSFRKGYRYKIKRNLEAYPIVLMMKAVQLLAQMLMREAMIVYLKSIKSKGAAPLLFHISTILDYKT